MKEELLRRVEVNPRIMFGKPVIKGTRLPVNIILEKLAYGYTEEELIEEYPFLSVEDIKAAILYAARVISMEEEIAIAK
ncbi:MAG: antitoxin [Chloroflexi bacterium CG_4_9_14_3_um_filter_45_9]|nr:MAG: antitoxin [Chloroflexi bacterium CG08_land_8_20_14_0_20_45_12]PIX27734.1 MAG: antitoxin [Chloroflexi bacterium CG_4_8_14_3_um_filter_45_15]PJB49003.1 MAG: antitoxin [Chloroflexi bacterium CG_4_9_14_3_um_filter_45_9]